MAFWALPLRFSFNIQSIGVQVISCTICLFKGALTGNRIEI